MFLVMVFEKTLAQSAVGGITPWGLNHRPDGHNGNMTSLSLTFLLEVQELPTSIQYITVLSDLICLLMILDWTIN